VISSGCHSFWRNDRRKPIPQLLSGVILLGAMRQDPFSVYFDWRNWHMMHVVPRMGRQD
jgi:hypothetical protein